jgi:hypothetical protein
MSPTCGNYAQIEFSPPATGLDESPVLTLWLLSITVA